MGENHIDQKTLATEATKRFLIVESMSLLKPIETLKSTLNVSLLPIAAAFEQNISAVAATVGLPFTLAHAAVEGSHWQRIHTAERIRSLKSTYDPQLSENASDEARHNLAYQNATERMREFMSSDVGSSTISVDTCEFLIGVLKSRNLAGAASELLRQGVVLTWGALEILSRDLFETILNNNPKHVFAVLKEPTAKNRLQSKFTLEELALAGFDVSRSLGSILTSQQDFSDLRTIKAVMLPILQTDSAVDAALNDNALWLLCQQRHLIVHRRGIVDAKYVESTGASAVLGELIEINPDNLESYMEKVVSTGQSILSAANKHVV